MATSTTTDFPSDYSILISYRTSATDQLRQASIDPDDLLPESVRQLTFVLIPGVAAGRWDWPTLTQPPTDNDDWVWDWSHQVGAGNAPDHIEAKKTEQRLHQELEQAVPDDLKDEFYRPPLFPPTVEGALSDSGLDESSAEVPDDIGPAQQFFTRLFARAVNLAAREVHIKSSENGGIDVYMLFGSKLKLVERVDKELTAAIIAVMKLKFGMDVADQHTSQSGEMSTTFNSQDMTLSAVLQYENGRAEIIVTVPVAPLDREEWIRTHGDDRLRQAQEAEYNVIGEYVRQRAEQELPGFWVDTKNVVKTGERVNPSAAALEVEAETIEQLRMCVHPDAQTRVRFLKGEFPGDAPKPSNGTFHGEVVMVENYLDRYNLYYPIYETDQSAPQKPAPVRLQRINTEFKPGQPLTVAFYSPKGGVGKSTTAANLAAYFAKSFESTGRSDRVLIIDGDLANGNLSIRLAHRYAPNFLDLLNHMDEQSKEGREVLDKYERDIAPFVLGNPKIPQLDILASLDNPEVINDVSTQDLATVLAACRQYYSVIIIDVGTQLAEDVNPFWLGQANTVCWMIEPEVSLMAATLEAAKRLRKLNIIDDDEKNVVVCIRADQVTDDMDVPRTIGTWAKSMSANELITFNDYGKEVLQSALQSSHGFLILDSDGYAAEIGKLIKTLTARYDTTIEAEPAVREQSLTATIRSLLEDDNCQDIIFDNGQLRYLDPDEQTHNVPTPFADETAVVKWIKQNFKGIDDNNPISTNPALGSARHRGSAIIPPVVESPSFVIRKTLSVRLTNIALDEIYPEQVELLYALVKSRANIIVSGATGTGKTTLLNAMLSGIDSDRSVFTAEEVAEFALPDRDALTQFYANKVDAAGTSLGYYLSQALKAASVMDYDYLALNEIRDDQYGSDFGAIALSRGGMLASIHSNANIDDTINRMVSLLNVQENDVHKAIDAVILLERLPDGTRRINSIYQLLFRRDAHRDEQRITLWSIDGKSKKPYAIRDIPVDWQPEEV